jgi:hypothetical protein
VVKRHLCEVLLPSEPFDPCGFGTDKVRMDDGSETEFGPGHVGFVPPGHDAWIVGNEPFVGIDFLNSHRLSRP